MLRRVADGVPAYGAMLKAAGVSAADIHDAADFSKLPLLNKENYVRRFPLEALIEGGEDQNGFVTEAEIFEPATGTFSIYGNLSSPRADHSATRLPDGRVVINGGSGDLGSLNTTEIFDPASGAFTRGPNLNNSRSGHSAAELNDGRIVFAGGDATGFEHR